MEDVAGKKNYYQNIAFISMLFTGWGCDSLSQNVVVRMLLCFRYPLRKYFSTLFKSYFQVRVLQY